MANIARYKYDMGQGEFSRLLIAGLVSIFIAGLMAGCGSPISPEIRKQADENLSFSKVLEKPGAFHGVVVIWGGVIINAVNRNGNKSAIFLWETPLDLRGKPRGREFSEGMFIASTAQSLDLKVYAGGRKVTIAGEIVGEQLGDYEGTPYVYPVVKIREMHLWEEGAPLQWNWGKTPFYVPQEFSPDNERRN